MSLAGPRLIKLPGRLLLRLAAGAAPEDISSHRDVRTGAALAATRLDRGGRLDQVLARHTPAMRVTRMYNARRRLAQPALRHLDWDDDEEALGLSRTFRLDVDPGADVDALVGDLATLERVEMASPHFAAELPQAAPPAPRAAVASPEAVRAFIGATNILDREPGDSALILGLVDTGVDLGHPELSGRLRPGLNSVTAAELSDGVTLLSGPRVRLQDVIDDHGHGTQCAGLIAAHGFSVPQGLAGAARLLPVRSLCGARMDDHSTTAIGSLADIDSGLKTCIDLGARVINLSFGTPERALEGYDYIPHIDVVRYAQAHDCVLVVASGNAGDWDPFYPSALPGVIAVGSVGLEGRPSRFTSRGAHLAVCAPGERLLCPTVGGDGYTQATGTSFAAPLVSAACALLLARAARNSVPLSPSTVRRILMATASPFPSAVDSTGCGAGILDVAAALDAVDAFASASPSHSLAEPAARDGERPP
jgi:subtilisin family serine protease